MVRKRVDETSIRAVAEEIGMSPSGLHVFLNGSRPHSATVRKIVAWELKRRAGGQPTDARDVDAALAVLADHIGAGASAEVRQRRLDVVVSVLSNAAR